jgi:trehalose 2-sulfotransferase
LFDWLKRRLNYRAAPGLRGYAICTAPRSGSNLLCQWLTSTNQLGHPLEYFNGPARRELDHPNYPDDPGAQVRWIMGESPTPNGIYGVKLFSGHCSLVSPVAGQIPVLPVSAYVYLERRDRLGQAISWVRALQTRQYRSTQPLRGGISYDGTAIRDRLAAIDGEYALWSEFFAQHKIRPLRLFYEECVQHPQDAVDRIAAHVGLDSRALIVASNIDLEIQRDAISDEWRTRHLSELGGR